MLTYNTTSNITTMSRIDKSVYRVLRKLGVQRSEITPETSFKRDLFFDDRDWQCFLFLVESNMDVNLNDAMVMQVNTVGDAVTMLKQQVHNRYQFN